MYVWLPYQKNASVLFSAYSPTKSCDMKFVWPRFPQSLPLLKGYANCFGFIKLSRNKAGAYSEFKLGSPQKAASQGGHSSS